jgi:hypothetical protein
MCQRICNCSRRAKSLSSSSPVATTLTSSSSPLAKILALSDTPHAKIPPLSDTPRAKILALSDIHVPRYSHLVIPHVSRYSHLVIPPAPHVAKTLPRNGFQRANALTRCYGLSRALWAKFTTWSYLLNHVASHVTRLPFSSEMNVFPVCPSVYFYRTNGVVSITANILTILYSFLRILIFCRSILQNPFFNTNLNFCRILAHVLAEPLYREQKFPLTL